MKIVYFTHEKSYGGSSRALVSLLKDISKKHKVYVVVPFRNAEIIPELRKMNVEIINVFYSWWQLPVNASFITKVIFRLLYKVNIISEFILAKKLKNIDADLFHSNTAVIDVGARLAKKLCVKHIWHMREFRENNLDYIKSDISSEDFIREYGGKLIFVSESVRDYYLSCGINNPYEVIYDGVSENFIIDEEEKNSSERIYKFLIAGSLQPSKGQELAIRALHQIIENGISDVKLLIAGKDVNGYETYLKSIVADMNLEKHVEFLGFVKNIKEIRKTVQCELMCSEKEAFGLVTVEAMLAGNLIIGSNSGGTAEIIKDSQTGLLYEVNNINDLVNKMKWAIGNRDEAHKLGLCAQEDAKSKFLGIVNSSKIENLYKTYIGS